MLSNNSNLSNINNKSRSSSPFTGAGAVDTNNDNRICSRRSSPSSPSPSHLFLQSPTHARSNSTPLSSPSHLSSKVASPTQIERVSSPEPFSPTLMSFASGYNPHNLSSSASTTITKPIAIYPQEHPQRKRFSPRFSSSGSYTAYSTALASTYHQQQQIQLQLQQQQQQQQQQSHRRSNNHHHYDSLDKHHDYHDLDHSTNHALCSQFIPRNQICSNRSSYNSPPSPCVAFDASSPSCRCARHVSTKSSSASTEEHVMSSSATSMAHCSPILSQAITALLPDVVHIGHPVSSNSKISSSTLIDQSSPLDGSVSPPSSAFCSTRTSSVSSTSSPARSSRTLSMVSESSSSSPLMEDAENRYFLDPCVSSPSPSPPLLIHENQGMHNKQRQRRQQQPQHQQQQQSRRRHARQSLPARVGDQSAYLIDPQHNRHNQALTASQRNQRPQHHRHHSNHSSHSSKSLAAHASSSPEIPVSPNSAQVIAQNSSRYIRYLWIPLLPLLIFAVGGQTSAKFESPVTYV